MSISDQPTFRITTNKDAYSVGLPADLIREFSPLFRAKITLGTGERRQSHSFDATCEAKGEVLLVRPDPSAKPMPFSVTDSTTFDIHAYGIDDPARTSAFWSTPIADIGGGFDFAEAGGCSGCSRDPSLKPYHGDDSMCWCWSHVVEKAGPARIL